MKIHHRQLSIIDLLCLRTIVNKSWKQHPTRHQLYGHLPPITKTIQARPIRHPGLCWRSRDELISDVLLWTPTYGREKAGQPARTYIQQLCEDTGCSPEDHPGAMNDREKWREKVRDIRASGTTWWWWGWMVIKYHNNLKVLIERKKNKKDPFQVNFYWGSESGLRNFINLMKKKLLFIFEE